jgi:hypothetical protein
VVFGPSIRYQKEAQKVSESADRVADHLIDKSMPAEEQERRKRSLLKAGGISRNPRGSAKLKKS